MTNLTIYCLVLFSLSLTVDSFRLTKARSVVCNNDIKESLSIVGNHFRESSSTSIFASSIDSLDRKSPPKFAYIALWLGLLGYAYGVSPGGSPEAAARDLDLIQKCISTPFDGTTNPIFVWIFNSLGIIPAVYASLLLCGAKDQKVPTLPFVIASFATGFVG